MAMSMAGGGPSAPEMNVTPLIDVLLVLIIIFMVIVSQSKTKGLEAQVPQPPDAKASTPPATDRTIVIQLYAASSSDARPTLKINSLGVSWEELEPRLFDIFKQRAEKVAFVQGNDSVEFQFVAEVIDQARHAGVERVGLLSRETTQAR